jgi:hypothetical protein
MNTVGEKRKEKENEYVFINKTVKANLIVPNYSNLMMMNYNINLKRD